MKLYKHPKWKDVAVKINNYSPDTKLYGVIYYNIHSLHVAGYPLNIGEDKLKIDNLNDWEVIEIE